MTSHMDLPSNLSGASAGVGQLESLGVKVKRMERPTTEKEAQRILGQAFKEKWTVFPCGGGTSLAAGVLPETVDMVLDTTGMSRVKTTIFGNDACGVYNKLAIVTTKPEIDPETGKPAINFKNGKLYGNGLRSPVINPTDLKLGTEMGSLKDSPLVQYVNAYKNHANILSIDANIEGPRLPPSLLEPTREPSPENWGARQITITTNPDTGVSRTTLIGDPTPNVLYLDPPVNQATGVKEVSLSGDVKGHGLLLINGNVDITGGFNWYGVIIASEGVKFSGVGSKGKNITGGVMAGETGVIVDINFTGSVELIYCSAVKDYLDDLTTVQMIAWREVKKE